jgi:chorismate synthase
MLILLSKKKKFGIRDWRGSGRSSARETLGRVASGAISKKFLKEKLGIEFLAFVEQVGDIRIKDVGVEHVRPEQIESNIVRCPDKIIAKRMIQLINRLKQDGDSVGGVIRCLVKNIRRVW